jgi:poly-gamma-glutamate synthesis protein (capsule biosynthesis protein)
VPLQIRRFRLNRATNDDVEWLRRTLDREGQEFGARVERGPRGDLTLSWPGVPRRVWTAHETRPD